MSDLFQIGLSGLRAAQTNLSVTGQNITNVNTPGYSRQTAIQAAASANFTGAGYIGTGAKVVDIQRVYNQFLTDQVRTSTATAAANEAYRVQIEELNGTLSSSAGGLTSGMQSYFDALQTAIEDPASLPARQLFLSEAEGLTGRFNSLHDQLSTQNRYINEQMTTIAQQVTRLAQSVADYNDAIAKATANGHTPNDLLDARDEVLRELSDLVGVTVVKQDDHGINLFVGSGQPLVVGNQASRLEAAPGRADPSRVEVSVVIGDQAQEVTSLLSGGQLGGLIDYRDEVLGQAQNVLGQLALALASETNQQLGKGLDLNGEVGRLLFNDINSSQQIAQRSAGNEGNQSDKKVEVRIGDTSQLTTSDYELTFSSATAFSVRRLSDNETLGPFDLTAAETDLTYPVFDGLDLSQQPAAGAYEAGDRYMLTPTRHAAQHLSVVMSEPEQLAFAAPMTAEADSQNRGTGSVSQPVLLDGPQSMDLDDLKNLGVTFTYENGTLTPVSTGTPAATITPGSWAITAGETTELEWEVDGHHFSMTLSGSPLDGDTFSVDFNQGGVADNRNALLLSELQTRPVLGQVPGERGTSLLDGYGALVQKVGTQTAQARTESEASQAVLAQATYSRNSVSAVNLDEEAANLIQFEQYYNASAQIIQVARTVFDTLINSMR